MDRLDQLRLFVEIEGHGSLSAAARARDISPSTVTVALQQLEEEAGCRLFHRTTRSLALTREGAELLVSVRQTLSDLDDAFGRLRDRGPVSGLIRVTTTNDFGRSRLAPLLHAFMNAHPGVEVSLLLSDALIDLVEEGIDLGLRTGPLQDSELKARLLLRGPRLLVASPSYWARAGRPQHPRELVDHNCLVLHRPGAPQHTWRFREQTQRFTVRVRGDRVANDSAVLRAWAIAGAGIVSYSHWDIVDDLNSGALEPALEAFTDTPTNLYAVLPPGRHPPRRVELLVDWLKAQLRDDA